MILQGKIEEEIIEANMIFTFQPENVQSVPEVISLLGKISVIIALPPKEILIQYMQCRKWTYKCENCAKQLRCFQSTSNRYTKEEYISLKNKYTKSTCLYPHFLNCIIYGRANRVEKNCCTLKLVYSKSK